MGEIHQPRPVLLLVAAFSRHPEALAWGRARLEQSWGPVALTSPTYAFVETPYYERSMGANIQKLFWAFERLDDPARIVDRKLESNSLEDLCRTEHDWPEERPLNLDPGYLTEAKLVLATTKDRDHRIYLDRGIYAEQTLYFHQKAWRERPWTYPDYRRADYHAFFDLCRDYLRRNLPPGAGRQNM